MRTAAAALLLTFLAATSARAEGVTQEPRKIVETKSAQIRDLVLTAKSDDEMREKVKPLMDEFVNFAEFGELCLGDWWGKITPAQKATYLVEFKALLQRTYLRRFKAGRDFAVQYRSDTRVNSVGDRAEVQTTLASKDVSADVDYRFHLLDGKWLVYDLVVDEVSVMRNYRKSFLKVLEKDGFDKLIEKMKKKTSEKDEDDQ
jgi:phospholipid transport system substrate-binding protein